MLFVLLFSSLVCQGLSVESYGKDFITAFPENVAYYHPQDPSNTLQITALYDDTTVSITFNHTNLFDRKLQRGQTKTVHFPKYVELYHYASSDNSVRVSSTKMIMVLWFSQRGNSIQSSVVKPLNSLGKRYLISPISYTQMMSSLYNITTSVSWRYNSFRVILINAENATNNVSIQVSSTDNPKNYNVLLNPYEPYQFPSIGSIKVTSSNKVNVLLTHPCVETPGCNCNMVVSPVLPQNLWGDSFVVPSVKNLNSTWLHVTSSTKVKLQGQNIKIEVSSSSGLIPFPYLQSASQFISASDNVSVRLIGPGFVLELIPKTMFAGCYLVQMNSTKGEAFIIAETASMGNVYVDGQLLSSKDWKSIINSSYSSVSVSLSGTHVIWHPDSKIGVYMFERMENGIPYGGPAGILNEDPDRNGCVAEPEQYKTTTAVMTWPESNDYCLNTTQGLSTPDSAKAQQEMSNFLLNANSSGLLWIGLRRSLLTLDWYWQIGNESEFNVDYTNWAEGHPDKPWKALCASVSQDAKKTFSWKSAPCCTKMRPVCYKKGQYFSDITFDSLNDHLYIVTPQGCNSPLCFLLQFSE